MSNYKLYNKFLLQVSWAKDHKVATTGTITIRVFDNDGYNVYRKVSEKELKINFC